VADIEFNTTTIINKLKELSAEDCRLAVFPELCITGYSCGDLFYQSLLLDQSRLALQRIASITDEYKIATVVGLPLEIDGRLYNCAAFLSNGIVAGIVPKTHLPTTNEYYEERWFTSAVHCTSQKIELNKTIVPVGTDLLFSADNMPHCTIGIEICEDLWAVNPPSGNLALNGATLLLNPSASNEVLGKADYRRELVKHQSARCMAAYLYAASGPNESTTDVVYSGQSIIAENGIVLVETDRFQFSTQIGIADIDVQQLTNERIKNSSFSTAERPQQPYRVIYFHLPETSTSFWEEKLLRPIAQMPFVPADLTQRTKHCQEIFNLQSTGLARRLLHTNASGVVLGISGGLDSTLALLVTITAFDHIHWKRNGIVAITMPGPGTTSRTRNNAETLTQLLGVDLRQIPITEALQQHLRDIGHEENIHDVTYENAQARERTQILMDIANQTNGFTVGTGDLSELALGWSTYNGDQMSMYHVNAGVPKTLVRYLIEWYAERETNREISKILLDICATPITPELLPLTHGGILQQRTEDSIGPYMLHDFFLFYVVRHSFTPYKIFFLARKAFCDSYSPKEILHWMKVFYRRFISQQFKRSAMPDGPKVGSVALSPRGDWRMPSDVSYSMWIHEIEELENEYKEN
jgi:NAD+ synthase (glutamine-hydrolysing)